MPDTFANHSGTTDSHNESELNDPAFKEERFSPLHVAAFYGRDELVQPLIAADKNVVNSINTNGFTPLHIACMQGNVEMVKKLVTAGAKADVTSVNGTTPLHIASRKGLKEIVEYLIKCEVDVDIPSHGGYTALHAAAEQDNTEVIELLLEAGADANAAIDMSEKTVLHLAVENSNEKAVKFLVKKANLESRNSCGTTPLALACSIGFLSVAKILIDSGANVNARDNDGTTPLIEACIYGHYNVVKLLIEAGADKEAVNHHNLTPIGSAFYNGHEEVVKLLLEAGADVYLIRKSSKPVHYFCQNDFSDHVRRCLEMNGANREVKNEDGWRPIHVAASLGYGETLEVLLKYGVDCDSTTTDGKTASILAADNGHWNIVGIINAHEERGSNNN